MATACECGPNAVPLGPGRVLPDGYWGFDPLDMTDTTHTHNATDTDTITDHPLSVAAPTQHTNTRPQSRRAPCTPPLSVGHAASTDTSMTDHTINEDDENDEDDGSPEAGSPAEPYAVLTHEEAAVLAERTGRPEHALGSPRPPWERYSSKPPPVPTRSRRGGAPNRAAVGMSMASLDLLNRMELENASLELDDKAIISTPSSVSPTSPRKGSIHSNRTHSRGPSGSADTNGLALSLPTLVPARTGPVGGWAGAAADVSVLQRKMTALQQALSQMRQTFATVMWGEPPTEVNNVASLYYRRMQERAVRRMTDASPQDVDIELLEDVTLLHSEITEAGGNIDWFEFKDALVTKFGTEAFDRNKNQVQQYLMNRAPAAHTTERGGFTVAETVSDRGEMEFAMKLDELCEEALEAGRQPTYRSIKNRLSQIYGEERVRQRQSRITHAISRWYHALAPTRHAPQHVQPTATVTITTSTASTTSTTHTDTDDGDHSYETPVACTDAHPQPLYTSTDDQGYAVVEGDDNDEDHDDTHAHVDDDIAEMYATPGVLRTVTQALSRPSMHSTNVSQQPIYGDVTMFRRHNNTNTNRPQRHHTMKRASSIYAQPLGRNNSQCGTVDTTAITTAVDTFNDNASYAYAEPAAMTAEEELEDLERQRMCGLDSSTRPPRLDEDGYAIADPITEDELRELNLTDAIVSEHIYAEIDEDEVVDVGHRTLDTTDESQSDADSAVEAGCGMQTHTTTPSAPSATTTSTACDVYAHPVVAIPELEEEAAGRYRFKVVVRVGDVRWTMWKYYSDFDSFRESTLPSVRLAQFADGFPKKHNVFDALRRRMSGPSTPAERKFQQRRRKQLSRWLSTMCAHVSLADLSKEDTACDFFEFAQHL